MTKSHIAGWALTGLLSAFLIVVSATVALAILVLIPRAAFVGRLLLTAYLGGALATTSAWLIHSTCRFSSSDRLGAA